jgi:hypothetical protein
MRGSDAAFVAEDHQREQAFGEGFAALDAPREFRRGRSAAGPGEVRSR